jgi:aminopeptidase
MKNQYSSQPPRSGRRTLQDQLARYAALILDLGVSLRRGQYLLISALTVQRDMVLALTEEAYRRGASAVAILYQDEIADKLKLELGDEAAVSFIPKGMRAAYEELIDKQGAYIALSGRENLNTFSKIGPDRQGRSLLARAAQLDFFYQQVYTNQIKWCVAGAATAGMASAVFPGIRADKALQALWNEMFTICGVQKDDPVAAWRNRIACLEERKKILDHLRISRLTFTSPSCDFTLCLNPRSRWQGGSSITPQGEVFLPNIPTEEVFTVPDFRSVDGRFTATRPLVYKNILVRELELRFRKGKLVGLEGSSGIEELRHILTSDPSHGRAGEIALVDADSSVARSGLVFHDLLYDENAQSHLAVGSGYTECLEGVRDMNEDERERAGFNSSSLHIDIMFGSQELTVTARTATGEDVVIMENGVFALTKPHK